MSSLTTDYLTSPIGKVLFLKSLPAFLALFANITYNLVDTFFVAKLGTNPLAAMGFCFPVVMVILNLMMGVSVGVNALASQSFGMKREDLAKNAGIKGIQIALVASFLITLVGLLTIEPLFSWLGAEKEMIPLIKDYMLIWYMGSFFLNFSVIGNSFLRAKGDVFYPSGILIGGAILNALLDPILIFGFGPIPAMGIAGAAFTTLIGNAAAAFFIFLRLKKNCGISFLSIFRFFDRTLLQKISWIAVPNALTNSFTPISTAFTNWLLISYGSAAVAANSIATRVETLPFISIFALGSILAPFVGQNWGANNHPRIREAIKKSFLFSHLVGGLCALILISKKHLVASLFDTNSQVVELCSTYFLIVPLSYGVLGTVFLCSYTMSAIGRPLLVSAISASRLLLIYPLIAYFSKDSFGCEGIFSARLLANLLVGISTTILTYKIFFKRRDSPDSFEEKTQYSS